MPILECEMLKTFFEKIKPLTRNAQTEAPGHSYIALQRATSIVQGSYCFQGQNVITDMYEQVVCVCIKDLLVFFKH